MDDTIRNCLVLIPALPLAAAGVAALFGSKLLRGYSHLPVVLALIGSFACSVAVLREVASRQTVGTDGGVEEVVSLWTWAEVQQAYYLEPNPPAVEAAEAGWRNFRIEIVLRADALTAVMLSMVTFVSSLVAIYASG